MRIKRFGKILGICLLAGISSGCGNDSVDDGKESGAPVVTGEPNIAEIDFAIESEEDSADTELFYIRAGDIDMIQIPQIRDENFILERERAEGLIFYVDISFPQLESNIYSNVEQLNSLLKDAAFAFYGISSEDALLLLEKEKDDIPDFSLHVDYDVLHMGDDYISVVFTVDVLTGGPSVMHQYLVTVDIRSREYIYFDNLVDIDQVLEVLQLGNFEVYAGTYFEFDDDDAHEPEMIDQFIKIFKEQVSVGIPEAAFDRFSSQNIGLDKDFLYIYFPAKGIWSFHDYYILRIPRKKLVFSIDI